MLDSTKIYLNNIKKVLENDQFIRLPVRGFRHNLLKLQTKNKLNDLEISESQVRESYRELTQTLRTMPKSWLNESKPFERAFTSYFLTIATLFPETRNSILDCALHETTYNYGADLLITYINELDKCKDSLPNEITVDFDYELSILAALKRLEVILSNTKLVSAITLLNEDMYFTIKYGKKNTDNVFVSYDTDRQPSDQYTDTDHYDYSCRQFYHAACKTELTRSYLVKVVIKMTEFQHQYDKLLVIYADDSELIGDNEPRAAAGTPALAELLAVDLSHIDLLLDYIHAPDMVPEIPSTSVSFLDHVIKNNEFNDYTYKLRLAFFDRVHSQFAIEYLMGDYLNAEFEAYLLNGRIDETAKMLVEFYAETIDKDIHLTPDNFTQFLSDFIEYLEHPWDYLLFENNMAMKLQLVNSIKKEIIILCKGTKFP